MKRFYYIFTATLLFSTSTLNAMEPENDDAKKIQQKINRLNKKREKAVGTGEDYYIAQQRNLLEELIKRLQYPDQDQDMQTALESSIKDEYKAIKKDRRQIFPKKEKKEEKNESKIALPKTPDLTLDDYFNYITLEESPFEEPIWKMDRKSYNKFSQQKYYSILKNCADEFTPTHLEPQRVPTKKEFDENPKFFAKNPFLKLTMDENKNYGGRYAICYYLQHPDDLKKEKEKEKENNNYTKEPFFFNLENMKGIPEPLFFILKEEKTEDQTQQVKDIQENNFGNNTNNNSNRPREENFLSPYKTSKITYKETGISNNISYKETKIEITTDHSRYAFQLDSQPIPIKPKSPLRLRYSLDVKKGAVGLGIHFVERNKGWLTHICHSNQLGQIKGALELPNGTTEDAIQIRFFNGLPQAGVSQFIIEKIELEQEGHISHSNF